MLKGFMKNMVTIGGISMAVSLTILTGSFSGPVAIGFLNFEGVSGHQLLL